MIVTTSVDARFAIEEEAREIANELNIPFVLRQKYSRVRLLQEYAGTDILVVTSEQIRLWRKELPTIHFHPSMAYVRLKRLQKKEYDPLAQIAGIKPGDTILDCTLGYGADALIFSYLTGLQGKVIGFESEFGIYAMTKYGLKKFKGTFEEYFRPIYVVHQSHEQGLKNMEDKSVDLVYFDPMFQTETQMSLRGFANAQPLKLTTIEEARRVARKKIILKEHVNSKEFQRLSFQKVYPGATNISYGVIDIHD